MNDTIERQAAIDAKQEFRNPNVVRNTEAKTAYDRTYANGWNDCNLAWIDSIKALPSAQSESTRTFVELVVRYPDPELCIYKEYKGKPYYSIKYIENGKTYVGYSTYNPEVLSQYLKEYFILSAQPEPSEITDEQAILHLQSTGWMQNHDREMYESGLREQLADDGGSYDSLIPSGDTILRQAAIDALDKRFDAVPMELTTEILQLRRDLRNLPSAQSERKTGRWILYDNQRQEEVENGNYLYICSECGKSDIHAKTQEVPFCWWCGADMRGEQE